MKFKIGDEIINVNDNETDIKLGEKYIVTGCDSNCVSFKDTEGNMRCRYSNEYELYQPPKPLTWKEEI